MHGAAISNHQSSAYRIRALRLMLNALTPQSVVPTQCKTDTTVDDETKGVKVSIVVEAGPTAKPEVASSSAITEIDAEAEQLLKGRVPQLADWIDAWASSTSAISYRKQERMQQKKGEARKCLSVRKRLRKQVRVLAEVTRTTVRQALTAARCISFATDSRGEYKVLRFRCDTRRSPYCMDGIIGVFHCGYSSISEAEDDHGVRMLRNLQACIAEFWTPMGGQCMVEEQRAMLANVRCLASDGCAVERKMLFLAFRSICPNTVVVLRDYAHVARNAVKEPLKFDQELGVVHTQLFDTEHAVVLDIQYSSKLKDLLVAAQHLRVRMPETQRPLKVVLRHLSFAKHRFDSLADPVAKIACMIFTIMHIVVDNQLRRAHVQGKASSRRGGPEALHAEILHGVGCRCRLRLVDSIVHQKVRCVGPRHRMLCS